MKKIAILLIVIISGTCLMAQTKKVPRKNSDQLAWSKEEIDLGQVKKNVAVDTVFVFKNVSNETLIINNVKSSCGCTVPKFSKEPVKPGKRGEVKVTFKSSVKGAFNKSIRVYLNNHRYAILRIKGRVEE